MRSYLPFLTWFLFLAAAGEEFLQPHWEGALVVFAALALVPTGLKLLGLPQGILYWSVAAGFGVSYLAFPNPFAPLLAIPYLLLATWLAVQTFADLLITSKFDVQEWVRIGALAYWTTGAVWAFCFLARIRPLGFDPVITGLTAAHFHVAGFVLSVIVYCLISNQPAATNKALGWAGLGGMPFVAAGITLTKLGHSPVFETVAALAFVAFAFIIVWQQVRLVRDPAYSRHVRLFWLGGTLCLLAGSVLAALYAVRFSWPIEWITIPNLKIWHGTLNAAGFGWLSLQGWQFLRSARPFS